MKSDNTFPQPGHPAIHLILGTVFLAGIFVFDLNQPLGVAAGIPYAALVMLGLILNNKVLVMYLAVLGTLLTIVGLYFQQAEVALQIVMTNRILAILLVWATAIICIRQMIFQEKMAVAMFNKRHDPLTSLPNRMDLFNRGEQLLQAARMRGQHLCLIAFGIDKLQELTDQNGTLAAEALTQDIAALFSSKEKQHYVANLASGVFVLIMPGVNLDFAIQHTKTLIQDAANLETVWQDGIIRGSLSAGVCQLKDDMPSIIDFFQTADAALRLAKKKGSGELVVVRN